MPTYLHLIDSSRPDQNTALDYNSYPTSESEWKDRYQWLHDAYVADPYTLGDLTGWRLFRAHDDDGKLMANTTRTLRDNAFVVDRDADGLFGDLFGLELQDGRSGRTAKKVLEKAEAVWKRSRFDERLPTHALAIASMGRLGMEVARQEDDTVALVTHDPRTFSVFFNENELDLAKVIIRHDYYSPDDVDGEGNVIPDAARHTWVRELTRTDITTWLNGDVVEAQSGPHSLGVVPFVLLLWREFREPEHGLYAAHGMERSLGILDSAICQIQAVGNRYGDPKLYAVGAKLAADNDAVKFGRHMSLPADASIAYLEPEMKGVLALLEMLGKVNGMVRGTFPEFGLFEAGANASGEALKYLAQAYEAKVGGARRRVHPQIARGLAMGVAMAEGVAFDEGSVLYRIEAGPILSTDLDRELGRVHEVKLQSGFAPGDYTRHLQRLGMVGAEHDPLEYEIAAAEAASARAVEFMRAGPPGTVAEDEETEEFTEDEETENAAMEKVAQGE